MKKRIAAIFALLVFCCVLGACGKPKQTEPSQSVQNETLQDSASETESPSEQPPESGWDATVSLYVADAQKNSVTVKVNLPSGYNNVYSGVAVFLPDGALAVVDCTGFSTEINAAGLAEVFPAYFEQTKGLLGRYRGSAFEDFEFQTEASESVKEKGRDFYKYTGRHTYTVFSSDAGGTDRQRDDAFVAYVWQASNGGYVYSMVIDDTEDQSLTGAIDAEALQIALSATEES